MQVKTPLLCMCLLSGLTAVDLSASMISGVFMIDGNITVTSGPPATITWANTVAPNVPNEANVGANPTGSFATGCVNPGPGSTCGDTVVSIATLTTPPENVGAGGFSPADPFITFLSGDPGFPSLLINTIEPGVFVGDCPAMATPAAAGQVCTISAGSPFSFINDSASSSTAAFEFKGVTSDGGTWTGDFSSNFAAMSFQQVLAKLTATGSVTDTFSAEITVTASSVPEPKPAYLLASGLALVLLSLGSRRLFRKQHQ